MSVLDDASNIELYERYVEPLEEEHRGEYIAIHPDGRTLIGKDSNNLRIQADSQFGKGSAIFKIGRLISPGFRWLRAVPDPPGIPVHTEDDSARPLAIGEAAEQRAKLYAQHGKPLEKEHWRKYVAIQPDGKTIVDGDYDVLLDKARIELGKGSYIFRLGELNSGTTVKPLELILRYYD